MYVIIRDHHRCHQFQSSNGLHGSPVIEAKTEAPSGLFHQSLHIYQCHDDAVALQLALREHVCKELLHSRERWDLHAGMRQS